MAMASLTCSWSSATRMVDGSDPIVIVALLLLQTNCHSSSSRISMQIITRIALTSSKPRPQSRILCPQMDTRALALAMTKIRAVMDLRRRRRKPGDPAISQLGLARVKLSVCPPSRASVAEGLSREIFRDCSHSARVLSWKASTRSCGRLSQTKRSNEGVIESMAIPATQLRPGMVIKHNNDLHSVFSVEHRTPGNLRAFIQAKLRNLRTGAMFEHRYRSGDAIEKIIVDEVQMEFLYADGDDYYFMNMENYEQLHLNRDILGDAVDYLIANLNIKVEFFDGKAVGVELPQTVELTVVETEPGLKSATASSVTKPAKTETGLVVQVPPFINEGEKIRVDTAEGAYLSRA